MGSVATEHPEPNTATLDMPSLERSWLKRASSAIVLMH